MALSFYAFSNTLVAKTCVLTGLAELVWLLLLVYAGLDYVTLWRLLGNFNVIFGLFSQFIVTNNLVILNS